MKISGLVMILIFLITGCSRGSEDHSNEFKAGNLSTSALADQKNYLIVMPFEWMGENAVTIKSVELATKDGKPINTEQNGIRYAFYGADPQTAVGVYQREDLGDLEEVQGFEVESESRLVLKLSLNQVHADPDRRIKVIYKRGEKTYEQLLESTTVKGLRTEE